MIITIYGACENCLFQKDDITYLIMGGKKKTTKKNQKSKKIYGILAILLLIAAGAWYLYGKPQIVFDEYGIALEQTEPPLIYELQAAMLGGEPDAQEEVQTTVVETEIPSTPLRDRDSGQEASNPALDEGHAENSPLYFGNPSDSIKDTSADKNYLMEKPQFTISYNTETLNPNWVAWHLSRSDLGEVDRADTFRPDPELPSEWYAVRKQDYKFPAYGFDRGHICPSADRTANTEDNSMTFLMTNMVPQAPDNNRIVWVALEKYEREVVQQGKEAYIFAGPLGVGGTGDKGYFESIPLKLNDGTELSITVPAYTWKIIIFLPEGDDDFSRIASEAEVLAVCVPNEKGCGKNGSLQQYLCSINYIEENTGYDFFELLDDELEENIESRVMSEAVQ